MKKRVLSLALALTMAMALLPAAAAESEFVIEDGVLVEYNGPGGDVVIPEGVTTIGEYAFSGCSGLTNVTIPQGVTSIGGSAFWDCDSLTHVTIPEGVREIGDHAFDGCAALTGATIPDSVTRIGGAAFMNCTALTHVTIPDGITEIELCTFEGCTSLKSVAIPQSVTEIGGGAFEFCESLTDVTLPDGLVEIGETAFRCCRSLTSITIPASVAQVWRAPFEYCTGLTDVTFADGVTKIWPVMFSNCTSLASVTIPDSVTEIELWAFQGCTSLTDVVIPDSVTRIGDAAFWKCTALTDVSVPASVAEIGDHAFQDCPGLTLHGAAGSPAEAYATENGILFAATSKTPRFTDVEAESWYEAAVELCAAKGIMIGTSVTTFSPEATLTEAECSVLALRLHDLLHGGDGVFDPAPEDWGGKKMTLTLADGTTFEGYGPQGDGERVFSWWEWRNGVMGVCAQVPGWSYEQDISANIQGQRAWMDAHPDICGFDDASATLTLNGVTYQGTAQCWMPVGPYVFMFKPEIEEAEEVNRIIKNAVYSQGVGDDRWYRNAAWYAAQNELEVGFGESPASRDSFAAMLALATGDLPAIRQVEAIPDMRERMATDDIYMLYRAGILTGKDSYGTFDPEGTLTRAEAATMAARVLDESLRLSEPLAPLPTDGYTLTYLRDGVADCGLTYPVCALGSIEENGEGGILLLDGTLLPWPGRTPSFGIEQWGEYAYFAPWDDTTEDPYDCLMGLMAADGSWAIPLENTEDWLDRKDEMMAFVDARRIQRPYACRNDLYWDADGHPVSQRFDWCGDLSAQGQGFVGLDGKIYRIQFEL